MQNLRIRGPVQVALLLVFCILAASANAQSPPAIDKIVVGKRVIRGLYPELNGRDLRVVIEDGGSLDNVERSPTDFGLHIFEAVNITPGFEGTNDCPAFLTAPHDIKKPFTDKCPPFLLSAHFTFPVEGDDRVFQFSAWGTAVNSDKLEKLAKQVDSHPQWSDRDLNEALENAGARFGPEAKKELSHSLPISTLKLLLGEIEMKAIGFSSRLDTNAEQQESIPFLQWDVTLISHMEGRKDRVYYAIFEPFQGKLVHLQASLH